MSAYYHDSLPPDPESKTGRVWELADEITRLRGRKATRDEVMQAYRAEGGNANTASTQYSRWNKFRATQSDGVTPGTTAKSDLRSTASAQLVVGADGRLVIPAEMRAAMQIGSDGRVIARVDQGELRLLAPKIALRRAQDLLRGAIPAGVSLADELIAERRAEARKDDAA